ncbi:ImmA/IrrE family metallo-endopeptidase, partial [Candidatus Parcubacteria bacterium]
MATEKRSLRHLPSDMFLPAESARWAAWLEWLDRTLANDQDATNALSPETVLQLLRKYLEGQGLPSNPEYGVWCRRALDVLGVKCRVSDGNGAGGLFYMETERLLAGDRERPVVSVARHSTRGRRRWTLAHELGHVVLCSLLTSPAVPDEFRQVYGYFDLKSGAF